MEQELLLQLGEHCFEWTQCTTRRRRCEGEEDLIYKSYLTDSAQGFVL